MSSVNILHGILSIQIQIENRSHPDPVFVSSCLWPVSKGGIGKEMESGLRIDHSPTNYRHPAFLFTYFHFQFLL